MRTIPFVRRRQARGIDFRAAAVAFPLLLILAACGNRVCWRPQRKIAPRRLFIRRTKSTLRFRVDCIRRHYGAGLILPDRVDLHANRVRGERMRRCSAFSTRPRQNGPSARSISTRCRTTSLDMVFGRPFCHPARLRLENRRCRTRFFDLNDVDISCAQGEHGRGCTYRVVSPSALRRRADPSMGRGGAVDVGRDARDVDARRRRWARDWCGRSRLRPYRLGLGGSGEAGVGGGDAGGL